MQVSYILEWFERIVPASTSWKNDFAGLQVGDARDIVQNVLLTVDVTEEVVQEALRKKANLIIAHHPLLFQPIRSVTHSDRNGRLVQKLIRHKINLLVLHTNLDCSTKGVSFALAHRLGLEHTSILAPLEDSLKKMIVFVPKDHLEPVAQAMHAAGGGAFSKYEQCSFRTDGVGTFKGLDDANPFLGTIGRLESVAETRLEMIVPNWRLDDVQRAMLRVHPYEEVAYDILPISNRNPEFGFGAIGTLPHVMSSTDFLRKIKRQLAIPSLRYAGNMRRSIQKVAVCGGSGGDLLSEAIRHGAEAFVTADIRYHRFQDAEERILLIDAGHFETERVVLEQLQQQTQACIKSSQAKAKAIIAATCTNPVQYY
jgi:dinuclear metal center YbgI/SA1388 family protein